MGRSKLVNDADVGMELHEKDINLINRSDNREEIKSLLYTALIGGDSQGRVTAEVRLREYGLRIVRSKAWIRKWWMLIMMWPLIASVIIFFWTAHNHPQNVTPLVNAAIVHLMSYAVVVIIVLSVVSKMIHFPRIKQRKRRESRVSNEDIKRTYGELEDDELKRIAMCPSELTREARDVLEAELERRRLNEE